MRQGAGPNACTMAKRACVPPTSPTRMLLSPLTATGYRKSGGPTLADQASFHFVFCRQPVLELMARRKAPAFRSEIGGFRDRCMTDLNLTGQRYRGRRS